MSTVTRVSPAVQTWPSWCDEHRWTIVQPEEEYRPTALPDFTPSDEDIAEAAGFELGYAGEPRPDVTDLSISTALYLAAARGWIAGRGQGARDRELARLEAIDRGEDAYMTPEYEGPRETDGYPAGYTS